MGWVLMKTQCEQGLAREGTSTAEHPLLSGQILRRSQGQYPPDKAAGCASLRPYLHLRGERGVEKFFSRNFPWFFTHLVSLFR